MITPALFKVRFSEFDCAKTSQIEMLIADAVLILNEAYWGVKYDLGLYYLTAHYLALANKSSAGSITSNGSIASRAVDGTSVSYNTIAPSNQAEAEYMSTTYGQRYLALIKSLGAPAYVI